MKKYIIKILFIVLVVISAGCSKDFLETSPTNAITPTDALSSPENMMLAINGIHRTMYSQTQLSGYSYLSGEGYIMPYMEFPASDMLFTSTGNGWFLGKCRWIDHTNPNSSSTEWAWYHYYHIIGMANNIINAAEGMTEDELLSNILGQAKTYRAWAHFRLVRMWARNYISGNPSSDLGVPLMTKTEAPYEGQARATVQEVYTQIEADLAAAIVHFGNAGSRDDNSHLSLEVAQGIAARVALTKGDWAAAATYAAAARQAYSLMGETEYKSGFNSFDGTEIMWGSHITTDQTTYYRAWFYYIGTNFNGSQNRGNPKQINNLLYAQISNTDYRKDLWLETAPNTILGFANDPNYTDEDAFWAAWSDVISTYEMTTSFNTHPFMSVKFRNEGGASIDPDDLIYMRASEMYLIEAEALARSGNDASAAAVLFDLVSARDADYTLSTNTGTALIDAIKLHRRIELWGEGHRWLDMLRYDEDLDRTGTGADGSIYQNGFSQDRASQNVNWLFQIPQTEIDANPNVIQNPSPDL